MYAGDTLHSRSAVAVNACIVASVSRRHTTRPAFFSINP